MQTLRENLLINKISTPTIPIGAAVVCTSDSGYNITIYLGTQLQQYDIPRTSERNYSNTIYLRTQL